MTDLNKAIDVDALIAGIRAELSPEPPVPAVPPPREAPSLDEVMRRVRHEIALRRDKSAPGRNEASPRQDVTGFPVWRAASERPPTDRGFVLGDFLVLDDADFVDTAYRCLLRRPPDEAGFQYHLRALRASELSKVEVLASLRWSPEGEARGVHVDGLLLPFTLHKWQRKAVVGPMIRWLHAWLRFPSMIARQARDNLRLARETHELGRHVNLLSGQVAQQHATLAQGITSLEVRLATSESKWAESQAELAAALESAARATSQLSRIQSVLADAQTGIARNEFGLAEVRAGLARNDAGLDEAKGALARTEAGLGSLQSALDQVQDEARLVREAVQTTSGTTDVLGERIAALDSALQALHAARDESARHANDLDELYARFEERFRGSESLVRERVGQFLPNVRTLGPLARVVDLGCGRGEWLEVMVENGIRCLGVDTNRVFLQHCRARGLDVVEADAIAWLQAQPDASVSGLTSLHLVEHLPFEALMKMLEQAFRVVVPGGLLLLETPNPENLLVSTHGFFMDPTHRNPLPPDMLAWLVQSQGFEAVHIERLTLAREQDVPPLLDAGVAGAESINALLQRLHNATDYAVMARRP